MLSILLLRRRPTKLDAYLRNPLNEPQRSNAWVRAPAERRAYLRILYCTIAGVNNGDSHGSNWPRAAAGGCTWAFDVDGTLIGSIRSDRLRPGARPLLEALARQGVSCVLWSAGGRDHALAMARRHELDHLFVGYYAKAERDERAHYRTDHLAPDHQPHVFVDDSPVDLSPTETVVSVPQFLGGNLADRALFDLLERFEIDAAGCT